MGLAPSGGGKDHSRKLNREILIRAGRSDICGPERIGSHAGIISALAENWLTLFQIDEIGRMLATMQNAGMSPHLYNIASVLMQIYSSADTIWQGDAYGDRKKCKTLEYPHCVVYGTSVPDGSRWTEGAAWPTINLADADRAISLNNYLTRRMLKQAGVYVSESIFETVQLKVMRVIMRREEWTQSELTRATRFLKPRERTEVLQTLVESGEIEVEDRETGGRPVRIFRANPII
jgi:hypothetical protein